MPNVIKANGSEHPVLRSAADGNFDILRRFVEQNPHLVYFRGTDGTVALHHASCNGNPFAVKFLVDKGANLDERDGKGNTPLHYAALMDNLDAFKILLLAGASIQIKNNDGLTPRQLAEKHGNSGAIIGFLKEKQLLRVTMKNDNSNIA